MYKQRRNPFNAPVVKVEMEDGVLGKANKDGTIHINKNVNSPAKVKEIVDHEAIHLDQMQRGDLDYDDNNVIWKGKKYSRKSMDEGAKNLPWEKEAYSKAGKSPLNRNGDGDFGKRKLKGKNKIKRVKQKKYRGKKLIDKIKSIGNNTKVSTNRKPSVNLENAQTPQVVKEEQSVNKAVEKSTMLPTNVVKPAVQENNTALGSGPTPKTRTTPTPPPPVQLIPDMTKTVDPLTGDYTYTNTVDMGNVLSGETGFGNQGNPITTQGINNNVLTRANPEESLTNLDAITDKLWNTYKGQTNPDGTIMYPNKYALRGDLKQDIARFREQRDIHGSMFDFTQGLRQTDPAATGPNVQREWTVKGQDGGDDQRYSVQWDDDSNQYKYAQWSDKDGAFSQAYSLNDPDISSTIGAAASAERVRQYEQAWNNSQENATFVNKWGGSRNRTWDDEEGGGLRFNPNTQTWSTQHFDQNLSSKRIFQNDAGQGQVGPIIATSNVYNNRYDQYPDE